MLPRMVGAGILWALLVGLAIGGIGVWLLTVRLARDEGDVGEDERLAEATWIAAAIERDGGIVPVELVDEVLELHQHYLRSPGAAPEEMVPPPPVAPNVTAGPEPGAPTTGDGEPPVVDPADEAGASRDRA
jgi:hypothetical protein